jgi:hypothetical protein
MKLKIIHQMARSRLQDLGQCKSCTYLVSYPWYGNIEADCTNSEIEKIPETTGKKIWGDKGCPCPFWRPNELKVCKKHGLYVEKYGCITCEAENDILLDFTNSYSGPDCDS